MCFLEIPKKPTETCRKPSHSFMHDHHMPGPTCFLTLWSLYETTIRTTLITIILLCHMCAQFRAWVHVFEIVYSISLRAPPPRETEVHDQSRLDYTIQGSHSLLDVHGCLKIPNIYMYLWLALVTILTWWCLCETHYHSISICIKVVTRYS